MTNIRERILTRVAGQQVMAWVLLICVSFISSSYSATLPEGFAESEVAGGMPSPTAMEFAPDGRLFVCQQNGQLRVIKNGALLPDPFMTITTDSTGERGLLGVAFDPGFATNQFLYVYYTAETPDTHNRVSRITANGDMALSGSEQPILDLENLGASNHNGGAIHFGPDGMLYVAVGENAEPSMAQSLENRLGKILRIGPDGSIPETNPFYSVATGVNRAIWALGLRNPFTFVFDDSTGRMFINDVGQSSAEEINEGVAGANYGWPSCEGACDPPDARFRDPVFQYGHGDSDTTGCTVIGGAFYPDAGPFPGSHRGNYFFADYCSGWIRRLDPATGMVSSFVTGIDSPVGLKAADGFLYYLARGGGGVVRRIAYTNDRPILHLSTSGTDALVYWPTSYAGYRLESTATPGSAVAWMGVTNPVDEANGQHRVVVRRTGNSRFFRLINP
jgi:glucose/arabinose dehydrogenase